ncbi:hypothetical protein SAMN05421688_2812 [Poseidonocella pacifica]|uniref:Dihydroorotate dehydrogenase n=1 Tax=Poseidonocella pacifica TaxID=871651 RepID=A0A1I0Y7Q4_9RHOB|nr:hypothetical protein [Poseidonocella pacifica]SFB08183.1 hypothetical protein SAMN05421688_2812 [Poseidonocella pacifica]
MTGTDENLDRHFTAARAEREPDDALLARVLSDALRVQAEWERPAPRAWPSLKEIFGGWPSLAGAALAGVAGFWIGVAPPQSFDTLAYEMLGLETTEAVLDPVSGFGFDLIEG